MRYFRAIYLYRKEGLTVWKTWSSLIFFVVNLQLTLQSAYLQLSFSSHHVHYLILFVP